MSLESVLKIVWVGRNKGLAALRPSIDEVKSPLRGMYFPFCAREAQRKRG